MKYVITGATSFIGIELTEYLLEQGHEVFAVCRPGSKDIERIPLGATIILSEMADYGGLYHDIPQADVFVNLAWAGTGHDGRDIKDIQYENIINTIGAMWGAYKMDCELFVEAGSQAEYGATAESQQEDMECHPFSEYGKAKLKVKEELFKLSEQLKMKYIHLRIFSLFGENDHPWTLVMSAIDKMLRSEDVDLSPCTQNWNFLYVKDAVRQIGGLCEYALSSEKFQHEVYNIASEDTRPLNEFVEEMRTVLCSNSTLNYGVVTPSVLVSLQPDVSKTKSVVPVLSQTSFGTFLKYRRNGK